MNIFLILTMTLSFGIFCIVSYLLYRSALRKSKNHVTRFEIYKDIIELKFEYDRLNEQGLMSETPLIAEYISDVGRIFNYGVLCLYYVKLKPKAANPDFSKELSAANADTRRLVERYAAMFEKLHKTNQPKSYWLYEKKIALSRNMKIHRIIRPFLILVLMLVLLMLVLADWLYKMFRKGRDGLVTDSKLPATDVEYIEKDILIT